MSGCELTPLCGLPPAGSSGSRVTSPQPRWRARALCLSSCEPSQFQVTRWVTALGAVAGRSSWERRVPRGVCPAAAASLRVGGLPARSPVLTLICLWTLLCLPRWASGMPPWLADGVGEGTTTGATLAWMWLIRCELVIRGGSQYPPWPSLPPCTEARPCALPSPVGEGQEQTDHRFRAVSRPRADLGLWGTPE